MGKENVDVFSSGHASEQDDFAIGRQFFHQLLHVPLERAAITGIVFIDVHHAEVAKVFEADR